MTRMSEKKVFYLLPMIALVKTDEEFDILYFGWLNFLWFKSYDKKSK